MSAPDDLDAPLRYCRGRTGGAGSSLHYSLLFLPSEKRAVLTALFAFRREIGDIAVECADAGVARLKLAWWRQEIAAMRDGRPQHPVTRLLAPAIPDYRLDVGLFVDMLAAEESNLPPARLTRFEELHRYGERTNGALASLSCAILGCRDPATPAAARNLGAAIELAGRHASPAFEAERALARLHAADAAIPATDRQALLPWLILAAIAHVTLKSAHPGGGRISHRRRELTPLRKLWIAWRMHRSL